MESIAVLFAAIESWSVVIRIAIIAVVLIGPFVLGAVLANALRMRDYGWKLGLIFSSIAVSGLILWNIWDPAKNRFNFKLGVDLQGGVILIYEVEKSVKFTDDLSKKGRQESGTADTEVSEFSMSALIEALSRRINPAGTKEIVIRPYGDRQVEIIIPEVDQREVEHIKKTISTAGVLQFRIVANSRDHKDVIDLAREAALDPVKKRGRVIFDESGTEVGLWARVGREDKVVSGVRPFKVAVGGFTVRDSLSGDLLDIPTDVVNNVSDRGDDDRRIRLAQHIAERGIKEIDVLMETNDGLNVNGGHLGGVSKGYDELMKPCIHFSLKGIGVNLFGELTGRFAPAEQFRRQLGIILDNELLSAPDIQEKITDRGRITGQFTDEEVQFLVNILQAGSLPVVLNKNPISSSLISPLLGEETIKQGQWSMVLGTAIVFLFMLVYYRLAGFVACVCMTLNILLTLALIVLIKAPLTLPGLAGLVLTVGMTIDSNVLIYERFREEIARGAALRMALRNGYNRATTTIVDSNLTAILVALVLYAIGTDQLRGFAVTLTLGILTSMFTAIFCSRVIFDIVERKRLVTSLKMFQFLGVTNIDFIGFRRMAVAGSLVVILIGVAAVYARGSDLLDIDFTGGSSVHVMLEEKANTEDVRKLLDAKFQAANVPFSLTGMSMTPGEKQNNMFKVDAKVADVADLEKMIHDAVRESGGKLKLATYSLNYENLREVAISASRSPEKSAETTPAADTMKKAESTKETVVPEKNEETKAPPTEKATPSDTTKVDSPPAEPAVKKEEPGKEKEQEKKATDPSATKDTEKESDKDSKKEPTAKEGASAELPPETVVALAAQETKTEEKQPTPETGEKKSEQPVSKGTELVTTPKTDSTAEKKVEATDKNEDAKKSDPVDVKDETEKKDQTVNKDETAKKDEAAKKAEAEKKEASTAVPASAAPAALTPSPLAPATSPGTATQVEATLKFGHGINAATLRAEIDEAAKSLKIPLSYFNVDAPGWDQIGNNTFETWTVYLSTTPDNARMLLDHLKEKFADEPVWPSSNHVGPTVAGRLQRTAIMALIASWLGIIIYVWIRFQNLVFGLAAVVALVHDVLVTVAAIAVSHWVAGALGFLLIEDFKINLTVVAALLTIIGYSINDTIVIFDRIREVRGKSPEITAKMVNLSVNQTLGRTLLTFLTTFIVVVVLYAFGGQGIHGFAFAMVIGMLTGTYSTVFIATPFVLWLAGTPIEPIPKPVK